MEILRCMYMYALAKIKKGQARTQHAPQGFYASQAIRSFQDPARQRNVELPLLERMMLAARRRRLLSHPNGWPVRGTERAQRRLPRECLKNSLASKNTTEKKRFDRRMDICSTNTTRLYRSLGKLRLARLCSLTTCRRRVVRKRFVKCELIFNDAEALLRLQGS